MSIFLIEILDHLFKYLDFRSKIKCRRINKKFLNYVDSHLNVKTAAFSSDYIYELDYGIIDADLVINNPNFVLKSNMNFRILEPKFFESTRCLRKIAELGVYHLNCNAVQVLLDNFSQISKLSIGFVKCEKSNDKINDPIINIKMQQLKELSLVLLKTKISIDLPKLKNLKLKFINNSPIECSLDTLNNIEHLEIHVHASKFLDYMVHFTNLKVLHLVELNEFSTFFANADYLWRLKKMERIYLDNSKLADLIFKTNLPTSLKVYYCGLNTENSRKKLDELKGFCLLKLYYIERFNLSDELLNLTVINYSKVEESYSELLHSRSFFKRFVRLSKVIVKNPIKDENKFLNFLKECRPFKSLEIHSSIANISNDLVSKLSSVCGFINKLIIGDFYLRSDSADITDDHLKAFFRFTDLKVLGISKNLSIDQIKDAFVNLKDLKCLEFLKNEANHTSISILKGKCILVQVYNYSEENVFNFKSLQTLFLYLEGKIQDSDFSLVYNQITGKMEFYLED